jgi:hypothetical protein
MRLLRVRFTVRRIMIAVALIAVLTATMTEGSRIHRRMRLWSKLYRFTSTSHSNIKSSFIRLSDDLDGQARRFDGLGDETSLKVAADTRIRAAEVRRWADFEAALASKYETAWAHPWRSLPPDPPEPPTRRPENSGDPQHETIIRILTRKLSER